MNQSRVIFRKEGKIRGKEGRQGAEVVPEDRRDPTHRSRRRSWFGYRRVTLEVSPTARSRKGTDVRLRVVGHSCFIHFKRFSQNVRTTGTVDAAVVYCGVHYGKDFPKSGMDLMTNGSTGTSRRYLSGPWLLD